MCKALLGGSSMPGHTHTHTVIYWPLFIWVYFSAVVHVSYPL